MSANTAIVLAQDFIVPNKNLEVSGVPPIPVRLRKDVGTYQGMYGLPLAGWDDSKRSILLKGLSSATWISDVDTPGKPPETSSIYIESSGIYDIYFQPQRKYLAYTRDADGTENFQLYLYDIERGNNTLLSGAKSRNTEPVWSNAGDKLVYGFTPTGETGVSLSITDAFKPGSSRTLVESYSHYLKAFDWSPDDKLIVYCDFTSNTTSSLWLANIADGKKTRLSEISAQGALYDNPKFSIDGKGVYVLTDEDSPNRRVAYIDLESHRFEYIAFRLRSDVEEFQVSPDGKKLAYLINDNGSYDLEVLDLTTRKERGWSRLPIGIISDLKWHRNSIDLAFNFKAPSVPSDVYSVNVNTDRIEHWTVSNPKVSDERFREPNKIQWPTFDGRNLTGFLYRPPAKFAGKRPVIIDIHGGPEEQYRPEFLYEANYVINELGVAKICPNVRGSAGFGKDFLKLDNGIRRADAIKDIGALLNWIKTQPDLDADRVLIQGASYGGYVALSTAIAYPDQIRGVISESGITDLSSFLAHTPGWRQTIQRTEFGDERDPKIKEFMDRNSPLKNAQRFKKPVLFFHGENDPRVPITEVNELIAAMKDRIPVWYVLAKNEGHGFTQPSNRDFRTYATILFIQKYLLN